MRAGIVAAVAALALTGCVIETGGDDNNNQHICTECPDGFSGPSFELSIAQTPSLIRIQWDPFNAEPVKEYVVFRSDDASGANDEIWRGNATSVDDTNAVIGRQYTYLVQAHGSSGIVAQSVEHSLIYGVTEHNDQQIHLEVRPNGENGFLLTWNDNSETPDAEYAIFKSDSPQDGTFEEIDRTTLTELVDNAVELNNEYGYLIVAYDSNGHGTAWSGAQWAVYMQQDCTDPDGCEHGGGDINTRPTIGFAVIDNKTYYRFDPISVTAYGWNDPDEGDDETYIYEWYINDSEVHTHQSDSATSTLFESRTDLHDGDWPRKGETVKVVVIPFDGTDRGDMVFSNSVVITNSAPTVTTAEIRPDTAFGAVIGPLRTGDDVYAKVEGWSDLDNDAEQYELTWYINGVPRQNDFGDNTELLRIDPDLVEPNAEIQLEIKPFDGLDYGPAIYSNTITVENAAPVITSSVTVVDSNNPGGGDIDATAVLGTEPIQRQDDSHGPVTLLYQWLVNGQAAAGATGPTFAGGFARGDTVSVDVTPVDDAGLAGTTVGSSAVTIANAVPTTPYVELVTSAVAPGRWTIEVNVVTASTDADGDALTMKHVWLRDNQEQPFAAGNDVRG